MYMQTYQSPFAEIVLASDGEYLTGLWFQGAKHCPQLRPDHFANLEIFQKTKKWLDIYFHGQQPAFYPAYRLDGVTPFRKQVIEYIKKVPYGKVMTYQQIAWEIAKNNNVRYMSAQAVGGAVGWNPISIIIPCHRIIGSNGTLTGYSGGIENKARLLELEGITLEKNIVKRR